MRNSALWAAWGDALGFVTELAKGPDQVHARAGVTHVEEPIAWKKHVGGRFGADVDLPAGTYSDDTQLRLAVARCIRADGRFDVETFSKLELPAFQSYALGAGAGTKAAAYNLSRKGVRWSSNFFSTDRSTYCDGGGNGAAMRIQPHVWAAPAYHPDNFVRSVVVDAVCTHGHMRGILGATFHALCLGAVLHNRAIPDPDRWEPIFANVLRARNVLRSHEVLGERWIPMWEEKSGRSLTRAIDETVAEGHELLERAAKVSQGDDKAYVALATDIGALDSKTRGSGMVSAVLALALAWMYVDRPRDGLILAANLLRSDTDTVASMAGAMLGAVISDAPPTSPADSGYIAASAERLWRIGRGERVDDFPHPDLLHWQPPRALNDSVGILEDKLNLSGLGEIEPVASPHHAGGRDDSVWQWMRLWFDQHVLVKRRSEPHALPASARLIARASRPVSAVSTDSRSTSHPQTAPVASVAPRLPGFDNDDGDPREDIEELYMWAAEDGFSDERVGRALKALATSSSGGIESAIAFAALAAHALRERPSS